MSNIKDRQPSPALSETLCSDGTGHGSRITLTVTGTDPAEREAAAQMWGAGSVGHLAAMAAEWAAAQPVEACRRRGSRFRIRPHGR